MVERTWYWCYVWWVIVWFHIHWPYDRVWRILQFGLQTFFEPILGSSSEFNHDRLFGWLRSSRLFRMRKERGGSSGHGRRRMRMIRHIRQGWNTDGSLKILPAINTLRFAGDSVSRWSRKRRYIPVVYCACYTVTSNNVLCGPQIPCKSWSGGSGSATQVLGAWPIRFDDNYECKFIAQRLRPIAIVVTVNSGAVKSKVLDSTY